MAFYTMLSLAPLLILVLSITSVFAETESIRSEIIAQVRSTVGPEGARVVSTVIGNAEQSREGRSATFIGIVVLLLAATGVFAQLQAALNQIWGVRTPTRAERALGRERPASISRMIWRFPPQRSF